MKQIQTVSIESLLQKYKLKHIKVFESEGKWYFRTKIYNYSLILEFFGILLALTMTIKTQDKDLYFVPLLAVWIFVFAIIWIDFNAVNTVVIDLENETLSIKKRNPIAYIIIAIFFQKYYSFDLKSVKRFLVKDNGSLRATYLTYFVDLQLKSGNSRRLSRFKKEIDANNFCTLLNKLIE